MELRALESEETRRKSAVTRNITVTLSYPFGLKLLQIQNNLQLAVDILVKSKESPGSILKLFTLEPGEAKNVPLYTAYKDELFVKPSNTR